MRKVYQKSRIIIALVVVIVLLASIMNLKDSTVQAAGTTYYISSSTPGASDSNNGTSQWTPWKTLNKINVLTFQAGDQILLKCGDTFATDAAWNGMIRLKGAGTSSNLITLSSYGIGDKPRIVSHNGAVIRATNLVGWRIRGLKIELDNTAGLLETNSCKGIGLDYDGNTVGSSIFIENNEICSTKPMTYSGSNVVGVDTNALGISINGFLPNSTTKLLASGITIANNTIYNVGRYGIYSSCWNNGSKSFIYSQDIFANVSVIRNTVYYTGINGILMGDIYNSYIKWNTVHDGGLYNGTGNVGAGPGGIWCISSKNVKIKFNEAYGMQSSNTPYDGAGLNIDWNNDGIVMQYNYSHDNKGPGITTMANINGKILNNKVKNNATGGSSFTTGNLIVSDYTGKPELMSGVKNIEVAYNTVINNQNNTEAIKANHSTAGDTWSGNSFHHNNIVTAGTATGTRAFNFVTGTAIGTNNNNMIYSSNGSSFAGTYFGTAYSTLASWRTATGFDANSTLATLDTTTPGNVTNLAGVINANNTVSLTWTGITDSGSGIDHYNIHRSTTSSFTPAYSNLVGQSTTGSLTDSEDISTGITTYYYKVSAEDRNGNVSTPTVVLAVSR